MSSSNAGPSDTTASADCAPQLVLEVIQLLERRRVVSCITGHYALIHYGVAVANPTWEIAVPENQFQNARGILFNDGYNQCPPTPLGTVSPLLLHLNPKYNLRGSNVTFLLIPSTDRRIFPRVGQFSSDSNGLQYPQQRQFIQSLLDTQQYTDLGKVADAQDLNMGWGYLKLRFGQLPQHLVSWIKLKNERMIAEYGEVLGAACALDTEPHAMLAWGQAIKWRALRTDKVVPGDEPNSDAEEVYNS
ncbi:hypothetical protein QBC35DRAFT_539305 [Podospora australis]|uniref:Uncharacterized protein n=1 Tax=Podospora australis TaxID=1536484 RepID=A0AAN6WMY8_9PEZI|nr:hypothetical protein QBC35DRAFT_539305 [Podospora australis]